MPDVIHVSGFGFWAVDQMVKFMYVGNYDGEDEQSNMAAAPAVQEVDEEITGMKHLDEAKAQAEELSL